MAVIKIEWWVALAGRCSRLGIRNALTAVVAVILATELAVLAAPTLLAVALAIEADTTSIAVFIADLTTAVWSTESGLANADGVTLLVRLANTLTSNAARLTIITIFTELAFVADLADALVRDANAVRTALGSGTRNMYICTVGKCSDYHAGSAGWLITELTSPAFFTGATDATVRNGNALAVRSASRGLANWTFLAVITTEASIAVALPLDA